MGEQTPNIEEGSDRVQELEVFFGALPIGVMIRTNRTDLTAEDLSVELRLSEKRFCSSFATFNCRGDRHIPVFELVTCPVCGRSSGRLNDRELTLHILGPETISRQQRRWLLAEIRQKLTDAYASEYAVGQDCLDRDKEPWNVT